MNNEHISHPLSELVEEGKHQYLEFKESINNSIKEEMVAFANAEGGTILIGVDDNGNILGFSPTRRQLDKIQDFAYSCEPIVNISSEVIDGIVVIEVEESDSKPVTCNSGSYIRKDATCRKMKAKEIRDMMEEWNPTEFDTRLCENFVYPDDFSESLYQSWLNKAFNGKNYEPSEILPKMQAAKILDNGEMVFTNAAVLMFSKNPRDFFPNSEIAFILFKGPRKVDIIKKYDINTGMLDAIEKATSCVEMYMLNAHEINIPKNGAARIEHPEYSLRAVRESLVNAVIHRDWLINGANIMVEMYRGRVIVKSPGELPKGVTIKNMSSVCQRRNYLLAELLVKARYGEKAGTGIGKMIDYCRELDSPDPVFESDGWVSVTFYPSPRSDVAYSKQKETYRYNK